MPHGIFKVGPSDYRLFKTDFDGNATGNPLARRDSESRALALLPALENAPKADFEIPIEWVKVVCPSCAQKMEDRGWKTLKVREGKSAASDLLEGLCQVVTPTGAMSYYIEARIGGDLNPEDYASWDSFEMWLVHYCLDVSASDGFTSDEPTAEGKVIPGFISKAVPQFQFRAEEDQDPRVKKQVFSVMGHVDSVDDRIHMGAYSKTITENARRLRVLWQHDMSAPPIGVPISVAEKRIDELPGEAAEFYRSQAPDATGVLLAEVRYLDTARGNEVLEGINADALNENSIGFTTVQGKVSYTVEDGRRIRNLHEIRLWDISPVLWGANDATTNLKSLKRIGPLQYDSDELVAQLDRLEPVLRTLSDTKAGRVLSEANLGRLKSALELLSEILDTAEPLETDAEKATDPTLTDEQEQVLARLKLTQAAKFLLEV